MTEFTEIPVLDAQALSAGAAKALVALADDFRRAYGTTGFGCIVNHGVAPALFSSMSATCCIAGATAG